MTLKSGTGQACAACKYQRRRCIPGCLLAPYFPADQPKMFQNVHRLFGVKHIQKLLKELSPEQQPMAMKSIKFHATMRDKYPVYGCLVEIQQLNYQIQMAEEELHAVLQHLAYYRQQQFQQEISPQPPPDEYLSQLQLGMAPPGNAVAVATATAPPCNMDYDANLEAKVEEKDNLDEEDDDDVNSLWFQQACSYSNKTNPNSMVMQSELTASHSQPIPQGACPDYNDLDSFWKMLSP